VTKKIPTIPFGAEVPPELAEAFSRRVSDEGWWKKRALAAAMQMFLAADDATRAQWYEDAYKPVPPPEGDATNPLPNKPKRK